MWSAAVCHLLLIGGVQHGAYIARHGRLSAPRLLLNMPVLAPLGLASLQSLVAGRLISVITSTI